MEKLKWLGGLVVAFLLVHTGCNFWLGRQLKAKLAQIADSGAPISMKQVAPPPVPEEQNAAPLYQKAFDALEASGGNHELVTSLPSDSLHIPAPQWATAKRIVSQNQGTYALLQTASQRPYCRFPVDWEQGGAALFPQLKGMRACTRFLRFRAMVMSQAGKVQKALDSVQLGLLISDSLSSEPSLLARLVEYALIGLPLTGLQVVLSHHQITPRAGHQLFVDLGQLELREPFTRAMEAEQAWGIWLFEKSSRSPSAAVRALGWITPGEEPSRSKIILAWLYGSYLGQPVQKRDKLLFLELMGRQVDNSKMSYREMKPAHKQWQEDIAHLPAWAWVTKACLPDFIRASAKRDQAMAEIGAAQVALALKAYQFQAGHYPASLQELRSLVPWDLPLDPFSGQDFGYRREGSGFILHSYGWDLDDDGGQIPEGKTSSRPGRDGNGDLAWRFGPG